jgi:hypothetical protein
MIHSSLFGNSTARPSGLAPLRIFHDVGSRATKVISEIDAIADYTASIDLFAKAIDGCKPRTRSELGDAFPLLEEHAVYKREDRLHIARSTMLANTPAAERMSARSKSRRWRSWVTVFLLRNSRTKLHLATV